MNVTVIGGGPGGYVAAIRAAQLGASVTLVEKGRLGGTCLNIGCIPTKCLLHSAELLEEIRDRGAEIGVKVKDAEIDFEQLMVHKDDVCKKLTSGVGGLLKMNKVKVINGEAAFVDVKKIKVKKADGDNEILIPDKIILATGSVNATPPIRGIKDNPSCIDSTDALSLKKPPKSMVVIGGGVIGLEMACAYAAFGTNVIVIEALDHVLPMMDEEISAVGVNHLKKMGAEIYLKCMVQAVESIADGAKVICKDENGKELTFETEKVLVAVGRRPNTEALKVDSGKINHVNGGIVINEKMETSVPGVYAIGDCVKGYAQLAHAASAMGEVAAENCCGENSVYNEATCPSCVYIAPEAASVGLTEVQCKEKGIAYKVGRFPMNANGKALIMNDGEGMVKIIAGEKYGEVLGMQIIGPRASDLIAEGALALTVEATLDELISTIHSHPTITEAIREAALHAEKRAIHTKN